MVNALPKTLCPQEPSDHLDTLEGMLLWKV